MTDNREDLIHDLVADLRPVRRPGRIGGLLLVWLLFASAYSVLVVLATGPLRAGALQNIWREPAFGFETVLAAAAIIALAYATLAMAIPGAVMSGSRLALPLGVTAAWVCVYVIGLWYPAHPVSTLGARNHCLWQVVLFSVPSFVLLLWMTRRLLPFMPRTTSALGGAVAAAIPGALMQFGCMYVPAHILTHHLGPVLIVAIIGFALGPLALKARRTVPRSRGVPLH
jgi:hypothetical protein